MIIDAVLTNNFKPEDKNLEIKNSVCGIIDTIRAMTTMSVMIEKGCSEIIICKSKAEAFRLKKHFPYYLLCGEEGGHPPEGFDYGNSPIEFSNLCLQDKGLILKTTNGTKSFFKTLDSKGSFVVSLANLSYASSILVSEAVKNDSDIILICSGERNKAASDDAYTAGAVISKIKSLKKDIKVTDAASILENNYYFLNNDFEALKNSTSYRSLVKVGLGEDISLCATRNIYEATGKLEISDIEGLKGSFIQKIFRIKPLRKNK